MAVTMRDVAAKAGVSPVVVSHVLHKKAATIRVGEATAERVRQAAVELGYSCNIWARNFRAQQTYTIGAIHGHGFPRPILSSGSRYFSALLDGLMEGAFSYGYSITLCKQLLGGSPNDAMSDGRFDGLVWYSTLDSETTAKMLLGCSVPLVLVHSRSRDFGGVIPTVICDNDQGIGLAVDHLFGLGHRRIAYALNLGWQYAETSLRLTAFREHMRRRGIAITDDDEIRVDTDLSELEAYIARRPRHTAIVANNEGLAAEIVARAQRHGIAIPYELSVVGFDSTSYCEEIRPTLTAVRQPLVELGRRAIDLLVQRIRGEACEQPEVVVPCGLDVRGSTAPPPCK